MVIRSAPPDSRRRRLERRALPLGSVAALALGVGIVLGATHVPGEQRVVERFGQAWERGDHAAMRALTTGAPDVETFTAAYRSSADTATATEVDVGEPVREGEAYALPVTVTTTAFGDVRGTVSLVLDGDGEEARIRWAEHLTFPGLVPGIVLERTTALPPRAAILARDNVALAEGPARAPAEELAGIASSIVGSLGPIPPEDAEDLARAGYPADAQVGLSGLERVFERELAGTPGGELRAGGAVLARTEPRPAEPVRTTLAPSVQEAALTALAGRLGGVVAMDPLTGEVLAAAGIAFSGLQPPGSTFKMITLAGALQEGVAKPSDEFPAVSSATLSGVELANANNEICGGTLEQSFAHSCNSVFAPMGAELGARRLFRYAERFGFNQPPPFAGAAISAIPPPEELGDDLGVGASAIGQGRVQASTLAMTRIAAAFANRGRLPKPTLLYRADPPAGEGERAVSARTARLVRQMMEAVVRDGTGTAAAISGVRVAGKTGTAELRTTQPCTVTPDDPESCLDAQVDPNDTTDTTAWFTAFAPADDPRIAVGVMLVSAGAGGDTAAPAARLVMEAALDRAT